MKLSEYIEGCQRILEQHGDIDHIYQVGDPECNCYNYVSCLPGVRYLLPEHMCPAEDEPPEPPWSTESLIDQKQDSQTLEDWRNDNYLDDDICPEELVKVILL